MTRRFTYIFTTLLSAAALLTGCNDDVELPGGDQPSWNNPDVISFTAGIGEPSRVMSRAAGEEKRLYEPLELNGDGSELTLYLHTCLSDRIGYRPGEPAAADTTALSRGVQVDTMEAFIKHHTDFAVTALYDDATATYMPWLNAGRSAIDNIWVPDRTYYWPSQQTLRFYAVAPSAELGNLKELEGVSRNTINFQYTARKGNDIGGYGADRDAEAQPDLMLAASTCNKMTGSNGHAPLQFNHALSAIKFAVRDVLDGKVVNIRITGVYGSGTCIYTAADDSAGGTVTWSNFTSKTTYSQNFNYEIAQRPVIDPNDGSQDILLNGDMPEKTFMLIPQAIPDDARIEVTLRRNNPGLDENGNQLPAEITVGARIKGNGIEEWLPGREYVYTISTSKDNWVTVFRVYGNHEKSTGAHDIEGNLDGNQIYIYSPSNKKHDTYKDNAYFKVQSYRYRANDREYVEALPWTATHGDGKQYRNGAYTGEEFDLPASEWITDTSARKLSGDGGTTWDIHKLTFAPHHVQTDWPGDLTMQTNAPYTGTSKDKPWDLSTSGGRNSKGRNTANCYVIDREGWYCFPLVYGNAIKNGSTNSKAYDGTCFVNHAGERITGPYIDASYHGSADMVWADVFNAVSDVELIGTGKNAMIRFRANKGNMQQGNVIIALYDKPNQKGNIVWSWHIWVNEHWLDPNPDTGGLPHAYNTGGSAFNFKANTKSGRRERGDVLLNNKHVGGNAQKYYIAPYNLGWCDPKNVDYLERPSDMVVVQYINGKAANTVTLPIIQKGAHIDYKYGNNTYYQWGRKDAIVGFVDHANTVKRNFGPKPYDVWPQYRTVAYAHKNPHILFCKGTGEAAKDDDWCKTHYSNLWDSDGSTGKDNKSSTKTVFDPSPPGYKVPPAYALRFIGTNNEGVYDSSNSDNTAPLKKLNGKFGTDAAGKTDPYSYIISAVDYTYNGTITNANKIWLTSTGNRWYTDSRYDELKVKGGDNFNPQIVYLWSCTPDGNNNAYGIALGYDETQTGKKYCVTSYFHGRRAMARPVRAIRE